MRRMNDSEAKDKIRRVVKLAISRGLVNISPYEVCGLSGTEILCTGAERRTIEGHHDDYNNMLGVRWMCRPHHRDWHLSNDAVQISQETGITLHRLTVPELLTISAAASPSTAGRETG